MSFSSISLPVTARPTTPTASNQTYHRQTDRILQDSSHDPLSLPNISTDSAGARLARPRIYRIGESVELQAVEDMVPMDFGSISEAFKNGMRGCLIRETFTVFCVCCCRRINIENSSVEIISDEGCPAVTMFPDSLCVFRLDGILYPLEDYSVFGFKLGDVISDPYLQFMTRADGWDLSSENKTFRGGLPESMDEHRCLMSRIPISGNGSTSDFYPPLPQSYENLPMSDKVFQQYCRARQTSVYVAGNVLNPEVGQLVARFSEIGCHILSLIVHVSERHVILRESSDYATRRLKRRWGLNPLYPGTGAYVEDILRIRRLEWWMTGSCKCVPMLPHLQLRVWGQWDHSELLHLSDGTDE
jgi:hypothetical protein